MIKDSKWGLKYITNEKLNEYATTDELIGIYKDKKTNLYQQFIRFYKKRNHGRIAQKSQVQSHKVYKPLQILEKWYVINVPEILNPKI